MKAPPPAGQFGPAPDQDAGRRVRVSDARKTHGSRACGFPARPCARDRAEARGSHGSGGAGEDRQLDARPTSEPTSRRSNRHPHQRVPVHAGLAVRITGANARAAAGPGRAMTCLPRLRPRLMIQPGAARCRDAADQVAGCGIFDSGPDAMAGHRLVIEARDDMQVRVEPALIIPAERVAVGSEPLVQLGSYQKQKFPCRRPLPGGEVERRSPVRASRPGSGAPRRRTRSTASCRAASRPGRAR